MGDEEAELAPRRRRPGADSRIGAGLVDVDRRAAAGLVEAGVRRRPCLVRAPPELGRLHAFGHKSFDRPGVDEDVARLRVFGALRVALGNMNALDAEPLGERRPLFARPGLGNRLAQVRQEIEQRLLDEPGHHAGVGAAAGNRGCPARVLAPLLEHRLPQRVVRSRLGAEVLRVIETRPGLDDGVDVERADLARVAHGVERGGVHREIDAEALALACFQVLAEHVAVIVPGEARLDVCDSALVKQPPVRVIRVDHDETIPVELEMPLDQRQGSLADRTEADHHDRTCDASIERPLRHGDLLPQLRNSSDAVRPGGRLKPRLGEPVNSGGSAVSVANPSCPAQP